MTNEVVVVGGGPTGLLPVCDLRLAGPGDPCVKATLPAHRPLQSSLGLQAGTIEMPDHRGSWRGFSACTVAPPFLNFAMFQLDQPVRVRKV